MSSHFVAHEPCPRCGSKDNLARYSDGGAYCFGCHFYINSKISGFVTEALVDNEEDIKIKLPIDSSHDYDQRAVDWAAQYNIGVETLFRNNVYWSNFQEQLIFTWWDRKTEFGRELLAYNARNFAKGRVKYFTQGNVKDLLPIYELKSKIATSDRLVVVEDCLSAIKISNCVADAMPCLGSSLDAIKIARLTKRYKKIIVWLDHNMYRNACDMAKGMELLGTEVSIVNTIGDPKTHRYSEINRLTQM